MKKLQLESDQPVTIYNAELKEVVGIFSTTALVRRYLFPADVFSSGGSRVQYYLKTKGRFRSQALGDTELVVRYSSADQRGELKGHTVIIRKGYPPFITSNGKIYKPHES